MSDKKAIAALNVELIKRETKAEISFCTEDDWVLGFLEGRRSAEFQAKIFAEHLEGLIQIATAREEFNSLSHARYILRRLGYDNKKGTK